MLTASHLTRRFGDRLAVDDVSFDLAPGEIFALLGPNGAGKTTTLRMLAGLIRPSGGAISIGGEALTSSNASRLRSRVGFLTETPGLWERLDVRHNLLTRGCTGCPIRIDRWMQRSTRSTCAAAPATPPPISRRA
jgi:ABC-2 type transport system ATP-binding protein